MAKLPKPSISLRLECPELDVNFAMILPVNSSDRVPYHKILQALASAQIFGSGYDLSKEEELQKLEATLQQQDTARKERHQFYKEVEKNSEFMTKTLVTMKRDYYREIDNLREQLSRKARDPNFEPDNVFFFDVSAYKLPSWDDVTNKLDGMRMQRELLLRELGGTEKVKNVPMHMLCQECRNKFKGLEEQGLDLCIHRAVQTDSSDLSNESNDAIVQTDDNFLGLGLLRKAKDAYSDCEDSCNASTRFEGSGVGHSRFGEGELSDGALDAMKDVDETSSQTSRGRGAHGSKSSGNGQGSIGEGNMQGTQSGEDSTNTKSRLEENRSVGDDGSDFGESASQSGRSRKGRRAGEGSEGDLVEEDEENEEKKRMRGRRNGPTTDGRIDMDPLQADDNSGAKRGRLMTAEEKAERLQAILLKTFGNEAKFRKKLGFGKLKDNWSERQKQSIQKFYARQAAGRRGSAGDPEAPGEPSTLNGSFKKQGSSLCLDKLPTPSGNMVDKCPTERCFAEMEGGTGKQDPRRPRSAGGEMSNRHLTLLGDERPAQEDDVEQRRFSVFGASGGGGIKQLDIGLPSPASDRRRSLGTSFGSSGGRRSPAQEVGRRSSAQEMGRRSSGQDSLEQTSSKVRASSASRALPGASSASRGGLDILSRGDQRTGSKQSLGGSLSASAGALLLPTSIDLRPKSNNSSARSVSRKDVLTPDGNSALSRSGKNVIASSASRPFPRNMGLYQIEGKSIG